MTITRTNKTIRIIENSSIGELNIQDIFLEVRCNNVSAITFYEKTGFKKISTRKNYYADTSEDAYIYKKMV